LCDEGRKLIKNVDPICEVKKTFLGEKGRWSLKLVFILCCTQTVEGEEKSISPSIYEQLFIEKMFCTVLTDLQFVFLIFWQK